MAAPSTAPASAPQATAVATSNAPTAAPATAAPATSTPTEKPQPTPKGSPPRRGAAAWTDIPNWIVFEHFGRKPDGTSASLDFDNRMVWLVKADGTQLHELAPGLPAGGKTAPDVSPDGKTVAFENWKVNQIWMVPIDGDTPTLVSDDCSGKGGTCVEGEPTFSADGKKLAFVRYTWVDDRIDAQIGIRDLASDTVTMLDKSTKDLDVSYPTQPSWSPDGEEIVYYVVDQAEGLDRPTASHLEIVAADDSAMRELPVPSNMWGAADPDWSPDGTKILFSTLPERETQGWGDFPGIAGIYTIAPDGTDTHLICLKCLDGGFAPTWSPDGEQIMFWGFRTWALMNADGSEVGHINQPELTWFGDELGFGYAAVLAPLSD